MKEKYRKNRTIQNGGRACGKKIFITLSVQAWIVVCSDCEENHHTKGTCPAEIQWAKAAAEKSCTKI